jgi:hypothetical protein
MDNEIIKAYLKADTPIRVQFVNWLLKRTLEEKGGMSEKVCKKKETGKEGHGN